jgi:periplasmic protein TonB
MVQNNQFIPTFDDIVFENRNKEYGAYQLRKRYNRVVLIATIIGCAIIATAVIVPYINASRSAAHKMRDAKEVIAEMSNDLQKEEAPPPPPPPPPPPTEQQTVIKYVAPVVVDSMKVEDESKLMISDEQVATTVNKEAVEIVEQKQEEQVVEQKEEEVFVVVEEMPEFPGGIKALRAFLASAVKYPVIAQENGIQGKVYVNFVVNKDGSVSNAKVARSVDPSLDVEALRVVSTLPKWKPGKQRGVPVRVFYTVPISFVLQ